MAKVLADYSSALRNQRSRGDKIDNKKRDIQIRHRPRGRF